MFTLSEDYSFMIEQQLNKQKSQSKVNVKAKNKK